jgi:hypothetical protein
MKSDKTIRRWIKAIDPYTADKVMGSLAHGMRIALECVLYGDWPVPVTFLKIHNKVPPKGRGE